MKKWKNIYEVIENDYFDESKVKFTKQFLTECETECNVPQFIPHKVKKKIQKVGLKYGLFSQILKIKKEVVVVFQKSFKAKKNKKQLKKNTSHQQNIYH